MTLVHLRPLDLALVGLYLVGITLFGLRFRRRGAGGGSLASYFLADNTIPWWAIALSIVSAETSTLTIISVPGVAFAGDFGFLQIVLGYLAGRVVVAVLFLPRYFSGRMLTAYQLIDERFGPFLHKVTAGLFLLTRAAAEGVRVFAVSIVVGLAIGTRDVLSIAIISALTLLYTFEGGMAAVIWTDVVQMGIYLAGTLVAVWSLGQHVPGGWATIHTVAAAAGKFHMLDFALNLTTSYTFWAGLLGGCFLTMASHGTDQLMVQRMLAARSLRESQLALLSSGVVILVQFGLFLLIGVGLWVFAGAGRVGAGSASWMQGLAPDRIFPTFIVRELPVGVAGLLIAAILAAAMSNLSAALNSLSSATVVDFYMHLRPEAEERERRLVSQSSTVLWALVLFAIAVYSISVGGKGHVVEIGLSIASVAYGCLLGVFLLGTLTRFATEVGTALAMVCGFALNLWLWQGRFPVRVGGVRIPHIAFTWFVLIGAIVTFVLGSGFSLVFRRQSRRRVAGVACLLLVVCSSSVRAQAPRFATVSTLMTDAIAAHKLPGAVVVVGHNGRVVFEQAYGDRKLAGEPGLDGRPSAAEPMTEDTIFDMASLSKNLATSTAVMQLYEAGRVKSLDDPVERYLPAFNPEHDATRAKVTLRMLLTHTSGEGPDISLKDPWGLAAPDREEGFRRALSARLAGAPGAKFVYSDINFILLGYLVEQLSGEREDVYARQHIFLPLGMTETEYLPLDRACGPHQVVGAAIEWRPFGPGVSRMVCPQGSWSTGLLERMAPTTHDDEGNAETNPHFDRLTRGTVHDPTTRRMGGVAGHAGVFSTAHDVSLFASALLEKLLHNTGPFPLQQATLEQMTEPEQPGHSLEQLAAASAAEEAAIQAGDKPAEPGLAPHYPAIAGQDLRGYGWDIDTAFSKPRGAIFPIGSFGHTGYTGTSLWMDPRSDTYVIVLANAVHPRDPHRPISNLRGEVATAAAKALDLYPCGPTPLYAIRDCVTLPTSQKGSPTVSATTLTGIDVLERDDLRALRGLGALGLMTNQTGVDSEGRRTVDVLLAGHLPLTTLFSPEHGISGALDQAEIASGRDGKTGLPVVSLYGAHEADRRPTHEQLKGLGAVVIDLQDAGVRYWTYEAAVGYFLEAASAEQTEYHHRLEVVLLDRPNPVGGLAVEGPVSDAGSESYVNYMPLPVRHGLTLGELARYIVAARHLQTQLTVVPMEHWQRSEMFAQTGLRWVNPSPNLRSAEAALAYPALGLIETTNVSVGRGTEHPFGFFGAPWMDAGAVAAALTARQIPGVSFRAGTEAIAEDGNRYPFHGQSIPAVEVTVSEPAALNSPEAGVEILAALRRMYPAQFQLARAARLLCSAETLEALSRGEDPRNIAARWQPRILVFRAATAPFRMYP